MFLILDNLSKFSLCLTYDLAQILYSTDFIPFIVLKKYSIIFSMALELVVSNK